MKRFHRLSLLLLMIDATVVNLALFGASQLRSTIPFGVSGALPLELTSPPWFLYPVATLCWVISLYNSRSYDPQYVLRWFREAQAVLLGGLLCTGLLAGVLYFILRDFSRLQYGYFIVLAEMLLLGYRGFLRITYRVFRIQRQGARSRVLVVGAGMLGKRIGRAILNYSRWGFDLIGYLDDDQKKQGFRLNNVPVMGTIDDVVLVVRERGIEEVWVALPLRAYARLDDLVEALDEYAVRIYIVPDYSTHALVRAQAEVFAGLPVIGLREGVIDDASLMIKRMFDMVLTISSLLVALPLMGLIALAIKLDSTGPALFRQERVGENGALFGMWKFRTMVRDAESRQDEVLEVMDDGRVLHKHEDDPRVTRVGRFLRRYSLDELPQLFNVLSGEMSLVGPRPEMPWLVDKYEHWQRQRFAVPQGITGWWQINDRSDKPMHLNTEDDLYYVYNYSLWLDVIILLRTPWSVLRGRGAF